MRLRLRVSDFGISGYGFQISDSRVEISDFGFCFRLFGFRLSGSAIGFGALGSSGSRFRDPGFGFRVPGSGFCVLSSEFQVLIFRISGLGSWALSFVLCVLVSGF